MMNEDIENILSGELLFLTREVDDKKPTLSLLKEKLGPLYREYFQQKMFGKENTIVFTSTGNKSVSDGDVFFKAEHYFKADSDTEDLSMDGKYFTIKQTAPIIGTSVAQGGKKIRKKHKKRTIKKRRSIRS